MNRLLAFLFLLIAGNGYAQDLSHKQYTVKDGLPGAVVYHTLQDRNGFIWFATNQGVSRFDGKTFKNFSKEDGLPDNEILKLYLDKYNNIWFITFSGTPAVYCKGNIRSFPDCRGVFAIVEDMVTDSLLLQATTQKDTTMFAGYYSSPNLNSRWIFQNHIQVSNPVYLQKPLLKVSTDKKTNFYFSLPDRNTYLFTVKDNGITYSHRIHYRKEKDLQIIYNRKSLFHLSAESESVVFYTDSIYIANKKFVKAIISMQDLQLQEFDLGGIYCENDSILWLCTRKKGLIRIKNFQQPNKTIDYYFPKAFCTSMMKDREGAYWVTTHNDGVYYIPDADSYTIPGPAGGNTEDVKTIRSYDPQTLLAGYADGNIILFNYKNFKSVLLDKWGSRNKNNRILDARRFKKDGFIIASDYGAYILSADNTIKQTSILAGSKGICQVSDSLLFIADAAGIEKRNFITGRKERIFSQRATCIEAKNNTCYWGTLSGMYQLSDSIVSYGDQYPALRGTINHIAIAPDDAIWVSRPQGLVVWKDRHTTTIRKEQGLLSDICKHVLVNDSTGWIATDKGVSRISYHWKDNKLIFTITGITENDGLVSGDVNQCATAGNYTWAATARGISILPQTYTDHFSSRPLINITRIMSGDQEVALTDSFNIDYHKNKLLIELSGISFRSGKQIQYAYRLADIDTHWNITATNLLEFSTLPFGDHTFEVQIIDRWGMKSDIKKIFFTVIPPFWKTSWFIFLTYFITSALIGLAVFFYYKKRHREKDDQYRLEKKMYELEMMALKAQMNPHFIFNCLSSIQYHILRADARNANLFLHKFSTLIRNILEYSTTTDITLAEEMKLLEAYLELEQLRIGDRMTYNISVDGSLNPAEIRIPPMIIQPYVENAIRHGITPLKDQPGIIDIRLYRSGDYLVCAIADNGIGINASLQAKQDNEEHRSLGTSITRSRIDIINAIQKDKMRLVVTDKKEKGLPGQGTIIEIYFYL